MGSRLGDLKYLAAADLELDADEEGTRQLIEQGFTREQLRERIAKLLKGARPKTGLAARAVRKSFTPSESNDMMEDGLSGFQRLVYRSIGRLGQATLEEIHDDLVARGEIEPRDNPTRDLWTFVNQLEKRGLVAYEGPKPKKARLVEPKREGMGVGPK